MTAERLPARLVQGGMLAALLLALVLAMPGRLGAAPAAGVAPDVAYNTALGAGAGNPVSSIAIQADGKAILGGFFTTWPDAKGPGDNVAGRIVRLNADGTPDTTFNQNTGTGAGGAFPGVNALAVDADGKILAGGSFPTWQNALGLGDSATRQLVRLNADGTPDTAFNLNTLPGGAVFSGQVMAVVVQPDGRILVGGLF